MSDFRIYKEISTVPDQLVSNSIYVVRVGVGFDLYITDSTGAVAHKVNNSSGDGLSAYDLAVSKGFTGSLDDWLLQVRATIKLSQESKNIIKNTEEGLYAEVPESKNLDSFVAALNAALEN